MKINSNTILLDKESNEFKELEDIIMKVAATNGIKNVTAVQVHITENDGIVGFKFAADAAQAEDPGTGTTNQVETEPTVTKETTPSTGSDFNTSSLADAAEAEKPEMGINANELSEEEVAKKQEEFNKNPPAWVAELNNLQPKSDTEAPTA
jgi:hypothetical protein